MKSIYGKLILGFLVSILFSFSIAGYFSLRKNSDELGRLAVEELESSSEHIADLLQIIEDGDLPKILSGYADKSGNANYNMSLSKKRVLAVKDELIKMGVNKTRIMEQYFGSEKATAVNNKDDRKVELKLMKELLKIMNFMELLKFCKFL